MGKRKVKIILFTFSFKCPYCGYEIEGEFERVWNFCPVCGRKVKVKVEEVSFVDA